MLGVTLTVSVPETVDEGLKVALVDIVIVAVPLVDTLAVAITLLVGVMLLLAVTLDVGDTDAMAENALKILKKDSVLSVFKQNALATAKKFDINSILPLYEDLYQKAIQQ